MDNHSPCRICGGLNLCDIELGVEIVGYLGAASAVMSIGTFLLDFFSRFRGCLGTIIFIVLSVVLGPLHLLFAIISTAIAIKKDS